MRVLNTENSDIVLRMLRKRRWLRTLLVSTVIPAARLGAADVVATNPEPSPLTDAVQHRDAAYRSDAEPTAALLRTGANANAGADVNAIINGRNNSRFTSADDRANL